MCPVYRVHTFFPSEWKSGRSLPLTSGVEKRPARKEVAKNREWPAFPVSARAPAEERKGKVNRDMTSWAVLRPDGSCRGAKSGKTAPMPPHAVSQNMEGRAGGKPLKKALPLTRTGYSPFTTSILRAAGFSGSLRGISMHRTPSLWVAEILSTSASSGRESTRRKEPYERSIR